MQMDTKDVRCPTKIEFAKNYEAATWRVRAQTFRVLAEPFDIAHHYSRGYHLAHDATTHSSKSHYLESDNRPWVSRHLPHLPGGRGSKRLSIDST